MLFKIVLLTTLLLTKVLLTILLLTIVLLPIVRNSTPQIDQVNPEYAPIIQPEEIPTRVREDAMGAYLMMFGALAAGLPLPIINLLAAVIYIFMHPTI